MALFGRTWELAFLRRQLAAAAAGRGGSVVVRGGIGTGRTTLFAELSRSAPDAAVLSVQPPRGRAADSGALRQLTGGRFEAEDAEEARRRLLRCLLPRDDAGPVDEFEAGSAVLGLLRRLSASRVVVLLVDDADALADAALRSLRYAAGRVSSLRVLMVFATAQVRPELEDLETLPLPALAQADADATVASLRPELSGAERARVVALAGGNPLALRTLPVPPPSVPADGASDVGESLRSGFGWRLDLLPPAIRSGVVLAAVAGDAPVPVLRRAADTHAVDGASPAAIAATGWVRVEADRVGVPDPLTRAALMAVIPSSERDAAAAAILAALAPHEEPDLRARLLALVTRGPDESVAATLDAAARRADLRDAGESVGLWLAAARLSAEPAKAAERVLAAGRAEWLSGRIDSARGLVRRARDLASGDLHPAAQFLAALVAMADEDCAVTMTLLESIGEAPGLDAVAVAACWVTAAWRAGRIDPLRVREDADLPPDLPGPLRDGVLRVLATWRAGRALPVGERPRLWAIPSAPLAIGMGVHDEAARGYRAFVLEARARGERTPLGMALAELAVLDAMAGRLAEAAASAGEAAVIGTETGARATAAHALFAQGWVAALQGDRDATEALAERAAALARAQGDRAVLGLVRWNRGAAALFSGAADVAVDLLAPLGDHRSESSHPTAALFAALDLGEAAARSGDLDLARRQQRLLEETAARTGAGWAFAAARFVEAMTREGDAAEAALHAVRAALVGERGPFLRARVEFVLGELLRRAGRRDDARAFLSNAADEFEALGAASLAERAAGALALMTRPRTRAVAGDAAGLTTQEARIAALAVAGASNKAIAAQLFISPRTVGHHLSVVYRKLEVPSRAALAAVLSERAEA